MATTTTKLMTFAEFEQLLEREGFRQELRRAVSDHSGQEIPLFIGGRLAVDAIFAPVEG